MADQPVAPQRQVITLDELFRQKGELVTQLEIGQNKMQVINQQIQQILASQPQVAK